MVIIIIGIEHWQNKGTDLNSKLKKIQTFYLSTIGKCTNFTIYDMSISKYKLYNCNDIQEIPKFIKIIDNINPIDYYYDVLTEKMIKREFFTIEKFKEYLIQQSKFNLADDDLLLLPNNCKYAINDNIGINIKDLNTMYGVNLQSTIDEYHPFKYIKCTDGVPKLMTCEENLIFDGNDCN